MKSAPETAAANSLDDAPDSLDDAALAAAGTATDPPLVATAEGNTTVGEQPDSGQPSSKGTQTKRTARRTVGSKLLLGILGLAAIAGGVAAWKLLDRAPVRPSRSAAEVPGVDPPAAFVPRAIRSGPPQANDVNAAEADEELLTKSSLSNELVRVGELARKVATDSRQPSDSAIVLPGRQAKLQSEDEVRHERWELKFTADLTLESYARELDFFGIELGVLGGKDEVVYLSNLSEHEPKQRTAPATGEGRLYSMWQRGGLAEADRKLAEHAKINPKGKLFALFLPTKVEKQLAELERAEAKKRNFAVVRKTTFGILPEGQTFRLYVIDQQAGESPTAK